MHAMEAGLPEKHAERLMPRALELSADAAERDEVPVAAIVFDSRSGEIISEAANRRETDHDPTGHAEVVALREAGRVLGRWNLTGCSMVVTLEPCPMCAGALINARLDHVTYGAADPKGGCIDTLYSLTRDERFNHRLPSRGGMNAAACAAQLQQFFAARRAKSK